MNGSLAQNIRRKLMPALEQGQGFQGTYSRAGSNRPLVVIPTNPDWVSTDDNGTVIEEWIGLVFLVSLDQWATTGFGAPQLSDRLMVALADGVQKTYALLPPKGLRPYKLTDDHSSYSLKMKEVKG